MKDSDYRFLGIEFGSTRIKAVITDAKGKTVASGSHSWENSFENGLWTYPEADIIHGMQACFKALSSDYCLKTGKPLTTADAMGISGMMHGYLAFDKDGKLLVPFRTWRNTVTAEAANKLSEAFRFNIPQRWSIAHLYQAVLNKEEHITKIAYINTLAGHIHYLLTGKRTVGACEASGMFPLDCATKSYNEKYIEIFDSLTADCPWKIKELLPGILPAGENAGTLTEKGAALLDPTGTFLPGAPFCPPEGDAGTGMAATNSVKPRTGNVSAGTSIFAMAVLDRAPSGYYPEIDMITTPSGDPVAMVHGNNCTGDIDAWVKLFGQAAALLGAKPDTAALYKLLFEAAVSPEAVTDGMTAFNCISGEHITGLEKGSPLFMRNPEAVMNLGSFMRTQLFTACAVISMGMEKLFGDEGALLEEITGHGGFFKTEGVGQRIMAAALNVPVRVTETAGEGGPWGMAVLASYMKLKACDESLADYLTRRIFDTAKSSVVSPSEKDRAEFVTFLERYKKALPTEKAAALVMNGDGYNA